MLLRRRRNRRTEGFEPTPLGVMATELSRTAGELNAARLAALPVLSSLPRDLPNGEAIERIIMLASATQGRLERISFELSLRA